MAYTGQLNSNEFFASLFNMIISQRVFADNISGLDSSLVSKAKIDGTLFGDTKLYYATDILKSVEWGNDAEATNLLKLHRPKDPDQQAIQLNIFRQIALTVDAYLTKRAWMDENAFSEFNSVILGQISDTEKVYDTTIYNVFIGTNGTSEGKQMQEVDLSSITETGEAKNRLEAQTIAQHLADLFVELEDVSRDYNDFGNLRAIPTSRLKVVWNSKFMNKITKLDLPTIFNNEGIMEKFNDKMAPRYFGEPNTTAGSTPADNKLIRSRVEKDYGNVHVLPGDLLPNSTEYLAYETYTQSDAVICKIYVEGSVPYMSSMQVNTVFFNPRSLTETHFTTFGRSELQHLKNYPFITVKAV